MDAPINNETKTMSLPLLVTRGLFVFPPLSEQIEAARA